MDARTLRALEWDRALALLSLCAQTEEGRAGARSLLPASEEVEVKRRHECVRDCREGERLSGRLSLEGYARCPTKVPRGASFPLETIRALRSNLNIVRRTTDWLDDPSSPKPALGRLFPRDPALRELGAFLDRLLDSRGEVADGASPALARMRREREHLRGSLLRTMEGLVARFSDRVLQQDTFTVRGGRLVLPVMSSRRSEVKGVLHDSSSTGATVFIEPLEVVEENNRLASLDAEEREEIHRILVEASARVSSAAEFLEAAFSFVEELDVLLACSRLASRYGGILPDIGETAARLDLRGARHPLLDARLAGLRKEAWGEEKPGDAVPLDLVLSLEGTRTLVISGPNAGGKSVALKTLGLLAAMNQAGVPVPAEEGTCLPVFPFLFASLGDSQSILDSLSTFSARMVHLKEALDRIEEPFLAILDELGAGTDPSEGAALGEATLLHLHARRGYTLCSTHHEPLKARALVTQGMGNACMEFSETDLRPTFRLRMGGVGTSRALEIAERSGLPKELVAQAQSLLPAEERRLKEVLEALEAEIEAHEAEEATLRERQAELAVYLGAIEGQRRDLLRQRAEWVASLPAELRKWEDRFLAGLKAEVNLQSVKRRARREAVNLVEEAREEQRVPAREAPSIALPAPGDRVRVIPFSTEGEVVSVDPGLARVSVLCQGKTLQMGAGDLEVLGPPARPEAIRGGVHTRVQDASAEINLIGMTVAEAEAELEPFLDRAALAGLQGVRVIHGIGTGRLRTAVRTMLKASDLVESFEEAPPFAGGAGATMVTLKG